MCDFSLEAYRSRKAEKGDQLVLHRFPSSTIGMARAEDDWQCPTCVQPGTELAFDEPIKVMSPPMTLPYSTATFIQFECNVTTRDGKPLQHRDGIETPDGKQYLLQHLLRSQTLRVLQVPAEVTVEDMARELGLAPVTRPTMVPPCYKSIADMTRDAFRPLVHARR